MEYEKNYNSPKLNILVAEDEEYNFLLISEILKGYNINIMRAYNGKMALEHCINNPHIDLILMDISMPVMDGLEATKRVKSLRPGLPVIIQSSYTSYSDKLIAFEHGCDGFLPKPFNREGLISTLEIHKPAGVSIGKE
ncbi:response regulator [Mangrovibacterium diazotrophicum]|uniref:CheY-like chemotaxis protein n=1 Tax=Mangrovibacterium diazotrophicum TaxID=1261403 RepID=A0A419VWQ7_9BACT|nr:response regulator [Mangrovibacterium diazotrophicum]RKD86506.1 CheY-like chemotaxis protein [Mangrovibacterium diazotrophicum]